MKIMIWLVLVWTADGWQPTFEVEKVSRCLTSGEILQVRERVRESGAVLRAVDCQEWHDGK